MLHANKGRQEWKCTWEGLLRLPPHTSVPASQKAQKVITGFKVVMGNICHTLSHTNYGLKFAINLNSPFDLDRAFVVPVADAKLKVCRHKSWPGAIITSIVVLHCMLLFCPVLLNKYINWKILVFHHCSAWGHRDKCRTGGGFLEADKTAFAFLPFEVPLVWHGWYGWVAQ